MNSVFKKTLSLVLALVICLSIVPFATFAEEGEPEKYVEQPLIVEETLAEPEVIEGEAVPQEEQAAEPANLPEETIPPEELPKSEEEPVPFTDIRVETVTVNHKEATYGDTVTYNVLFNQPVDGRVEICLRSEDGNHWIYFYNNGTNELTQVINNTIESGKYYIRNIWVDSDRGSFTFVDTRFRDEFGSASSNLYTDLSAGDIVIIGTKPELDVSVESISVDKRVVTYGDIISVCIKTSESGNRHCDSCSIRQANGGGMGISCAKVALDRYEAVCSIEEWMTPGTYVISDLYFRDEINNYRRFINSKFPEPDGVLLDESITKEAEFILVATEEEKEALIRELSASEENRRMGENVFWTIDENGVLTISGSGAMNDDCTSALALCRDAVKEVIIQDGITSIGGNAFLNCKAMKKITIPASVTSIDGGAFGYSDYLQIIFKGDTPAFSENAFYGSRVYAYYPSNNSTWTQVFTTYFDGNVTWKEYGNEEEIAAPIADLQIEAITVNHKEATYGDTVTYNVTFDQPVTGRVEVYLSSENGNRGLNFYSNGINELTRVINNNIESGKYYVRNIWVDSDRGSFTFVDSRWRDEYGSASVNIYTDLSAGDIVITGIKPELDVTVESISVSNRVVTYGDTINAVIKTSGADSNIRCDYCHAMSNINSLYMYGYQIAANEYQVTCSMEDWLTPGTYSISDLYFCDNINNSKRFINSKYSYSDGILLDENVTANAEFILVATEAEKEALIRELSLSEGNYRMGGTVHWTIDANGLLMVYGFGQMYDDCTAALALCRDSVKEVVFQNGITSIGDYAFSNCKNLTSVTLPDSLETIGSCAFDNCDSLKRISVPASVANIGNRAFGYSDYLQIIFEGDAPAFSENAFYGSQVYAYYPSNNSTWEQIVTTYFNGNVTWKEYGNAEEIAAPITDLQVEAISVNHKEATYGDTVTHNVTFNQPVDGRVEVCLRSENGREYYLSIPGNGANTLSQVINNTFEAEKYYVRNIWLDSDRGSFTFVDTRFRDEFGSASGNIYTDLSAGDIVITGIKPELDVSVESVLLNKQVATYGENLQVTIRTSGNADISNFSIIFNSPKGYASASAYTKLAPNLYTGTILLEETAWMPAGAYTISEIYAYDSDGNKKTFVNAANSGNHGMNLDESVVESAQFILAGTEEEKQELLNSPEYSEAFPAGKLYGTQIESAAFSQTNVTYGDNVTFQVGFDTEAEISKVVAAINWYNSSSIEVCFEPEFVKNEESGKYEVSFSVAEDLYATRFGILYIAVYDTEGNSKCFYNGSIYYSNIPSTFEVYESADFRNCYFHVYNTEPINDISIESISIGSGNVTYGDILPIKIALDCSKTLNVSIYLRSQEGTSGREYILEKNPESGLYECNALIDAALDPGIIGIGSIRVWYEDYSIVFYNQQFYPYSSNNGDVVMDFSPYSFTLSGTKPEFDVAIDKISVNKHVVVKNDIIKVRVYVSGDTEIDNLTCSIANNNYGMGGWNCVQVAPEIYEASFFMEEWIPCGDYKVTDIVITDVFGNRVLFSDSNASNTTVIQIDDRVMEEAVFTLVETQQEKEELIQTIPDYQEYEWINEDAPWKIDENGVLIISGSGPMDVNYSRAFRSYFDKISEVIIEDGVTTICAEAFTTYTDNNSIKKVTIPESVTSIGDYAFNGCVNLTDISIPSSVTSIGPYAFSTCEGLTEITIPASVNDIGLCAFEGCTSLKRIIFEGNAPHLGSSCFKKVAATAYYSNNASGWTDENKSTCRGQITWVGLPSDAMHARILFDAAKDYYFGNSAELGIDVAALNAVSADLLSAYGMSESGSLPDGIAYEGTSLTLEDTVMVRHFFTLSGDVENYTFKLGTTVVTPVQRGQYYTVDVEGIPFSALDQPHTIEVTSGSSQWSMSYCPLSYAYKALAAGTDDNLCTLMKAMYLYYLALNA